MMDGHYSLAITVGNRPTGKYGNVKPYRFFWLHALIESHRYSTVLQGLIEQKRTTNKRKGTATANHIKNLASVLRTIVRKYEFTSRVILTRTTNRVQ